MKRIALFLITNLAILVVLSVVLSLLGVDSLLAENGVDLDLQALLIFFCGYRYDRLIYFTAYVKVVCQANDWRESYCSC